LSIEKNRIGFSPIQAQKQAQKNNFKNSC
jgi:hypothetical protein